MLSVNCSEDAASRVYEVLDANVKKYRVKSRSHNARGLNLCVELPAGDIAGLEEKLAALDLDRFSILEYDAEDIL